MKFRLNLPDLASKKARKSIKAIRKSKIDTKAVETWNELRLVGTEGAFRKQFGKKGEDEIDEEEIMKEAQDWDLLIAQFNEQYTQQLKHDRTHEKDDDVSSISTIAETKSELMESRRRRKIIYRKCFIATCILIWFIMTFCENFQITSLIGVNEWHLVYHIYPIGFLTELDIGVTATYYEAKSGWIVLAAYLSVHAVASVGIILSLCFQHKPQYMRQYILRAPLILGVPIMTILVNVQFTGLISTQKLSHVLDAAISKYHDKTKPDVQKFYIAEWDKLQNHLQCCGISGSTDWESVDNNLPSDSTYIPESCCPKPFFRNQWSKEPPQKDDCFYKYNKKTDKGYEWAYPEGCLNIAFEFYKQNGVFKVGLGCFQFLILVINFALGKQLYSVMKKCDQLQFKYTWKRYFSEIFFMNVCAAIFGCCCHFPCCKSICRCKCARRCDKKKRKTASGSENNMQHEEFEISEQESLEVIKPPDSTTETDSHTVVTLSKPAKPRYPKVILTAPSDVDIPGESAQSSEVLLLGDKVDLEKGPPEPNSPLLKEPEKATDEEYPLPNVSSASLMQTTTADESLASTVASSVVNEKDDDDLVKDSLMNMFDQSSSSKGKKKQTGKSGKVRNRRKK